MILQECKGVNALRITLTLTSESHPTWGVVTIVVSEIENRSRRHSPEMAIYGNEKTPLCRDCLTKRRVIKKLILHACGLLLVKVPPRPLQAASHIAQVPNGLKLPPRFDRVECLCTNNHRREVFFSELRIS